MYNRLAKASLNWWVIVPPASLMRQCSTGNGRLRTLTSSDRSATAAPAEHGGSEIFSVPPHPPEGCRSHTFPHHQNLQLRAAAAAKHHLGWLKHSQGSVIPRAAPSSAPHPGRGSWAKSRDAPGRPPGATPSTAGPRRRKGARPLPAGGRSAAARWAMLLKCCGCRERRDGVGSASMSLMDRGVREYEI